MRLLLRQLGGRPRCSEAGVAGDGSGGTSDDVPARAGPGKYLTMDEVETKKVEEIESSGWFDTSISHPRVYPG